MTGMREQKYAERLWYEPLSHSGDCDRIHQPMAVPLPVIEL